MIKDHRGCRSEIGVGKLVVSTQSQDFIVVWWTLKQTGLTVDAFLSRLRWDEAHDAKRPNLI